MENRAHAFVAGIFTLLFGLGVVLSVLWFKHDQPNRIKFELYTHKTITGLNKQATVKYRGIEVGKVSAIGFNPRQRGEIIIQIEVDENTPITQDTYATLDYQGITGLAFVQLNSSGQNSQLLISNNNTPSRIELRPGLLDNVASRGEAILAQTEQLTKSLNVLLSNDNLKTISASLNHFNEAAEGITTSLTQINKAFEKVGRASDNVTRAMQPWRVTGKQATQLLYDLQKPGGTVAKLDQTMAGLNQAVGDVKQAITQVRTTTIPKLNTTLDEASSTLQGVNQAVDSFSENPSRILFDEAPAKGPGEPGFKFPKREKSADKTTGSQK